MKMLLVFATDREFSLLRNELRQYESGINQYKFKDHQLQVLITGVGMANTIFHLTKELLSNSYDLVINLGICGSFKNEFEMGEVVCIHKDRFADWGIIENGQFKDVFDMGLENQNNFPFQNGWLSHDVPESLKEFLPDCSVMGFTVNTIRAKGYDLLDNKYDADVESMEGAAFFYVCSQIKVSSIQLRAVSNIVGERDKQKWDFVSALKNLTDYFINGFLKKL